MQEVTNYTVMINILHAHTHLLPSKYMLVEIELQLFIGYVDTQLLKRVGTEILEPKNVQNSNVSHILFPTERGK